MKKTLYLSTVLLLLAIACQRSDIMLYSDMARIQLNDTSTIGSTFVYEPSTVLRDTVYIQVNTIGGITDYDRPVQLEQEQELMDSLIYDPQTNLVVDTVQRPRPYQAVPGVHYVDFNDPSIRELMVVKAREVSAMIPIVLLRDESLQANSYRLRLTLRPNDQFGLGESQRRSCTIQFSDRLERFYSWRIDGTQAPAFLTFGRYSMRKHQFMIDVLQTRIDEEWYLAMAAVQAQQHYKNLLQEALEQFNSNPANIARGIAPMRETDDPNSPAITFP